jgi:hypothetical protein
VDHPSPPRLRHRTHPLPDLSAGSSPGLQLSSRGSGRVEAAKPGDAVLHDAAGEYGAEEPPRLAHGDGEAIAAVADLLGQGVRDPEAGQAADRFALGDEVARGQQGLGPGQHDQAVVDPGVL